MQVRAKVEPGKKESNWWHMQVRAKVKPGKNKYNNVWHKKKIKRILIKVLSTFYSNLQPTRFIFFIFILWYLESLCLNISNKNNLFNYLSFLIGFKYIFNLNIFIIMFTIKLSVLILVITSSFQLHCVLNCFHLHLYVCLLNGV